MILKDASPPGSDNHLAFLGHSSYTWSVPIALHLLQSIAERFGLLNRSVREAVAKHIARDRNSGPWILAVCNRMSRLTARLLRLIAQTEAGTLPKPRKRPARNPEPAAKPEAPTKQPDTSPTPKLSRAFGWLGRTVWEARVSGSQLTFLLDQPEVQAFLQATPQAGRVLRPLCQMLGVTLPPVLQLPVRPRRPRPPRPKRPRPGAPHYEQPLGWERYGFSEPWRAGPPPRTRRSRKPA